MATFALGTWPNLRFARAQRDSRKGEDRCTTPEASEAAPHLPCAFAIFDGHSGSVTAAVCANEVCKRLLAAGPPFSESTIADVFWSVDEEVGMMGARDGATATVLLVEDGGKHGGFRCTLAWCGDSSAVVSDMSDGTVLFATASHTAGPDHQGGGAHEQERQQLAMYSAVRQHLEEQHGIDSSANEVSVEMVRKALTAVHVSDSKEREAELVALLMRALRRSRLMANKLPDKAQSRKQLYVRQRDPEHDVNRVWVVSTAQHRSDPGYFDLQMTRSIGDWRASDMVLPEPHVHRFDVPFDCIFRVCLASDGLWDCCRFEDSAKEMWRARSVASASRSLIRYAEKEYLEERGHDLMDDDTTVLVIELSPSSKAHTPPKAAAAEAGCVLS
mmetsp:Transcript_27434/g.69806  ORF Transcript_27434/g.69806 Transcript_27434/m.69806 type:complete len:387 (+) Transcript_27434:58-1218(+)